MKQNKMCIRDSINKYNTKHSEAIITNNYEHAQKFLDEVDAAAVYVNASTRFTDGFEMCIRDSLRPLYDALYQIMGADSFAKNMERGLIEVAPLAYMRGRTLDNAFIILDEAQNTTPAQMKMFRCV